jgi:hypothetical protein
MIAPTISGPWGGRVTASVWNWSSSTTLLV